MGANWWANWRQTGKKANWEGKLGGRQTEANWDTIDLQEGKLKANWTPIDLRQTGTPIDLRQTGTPIDLQEGKLGHP